MKKVLSFVLALVIACLFVGCKKDETAQLNNESNNESSKYSYDDIVCVQTDRYKNCKFDVSNSNTLLSIKLPEQWRFIKEQNGYSIRKGSEVIGSLSSAIDEKFAANSVNAFNSSVSNNGIDIVHNIDYIVSNGSADFTRTISYSYKDNSGAPLKVFISVNYKELDTNAVLKMLESAKLTVRFSESNKGILHVTDNRKKILILGNSFIGSSNIGRILQTMCGDSMEVEAYSRGYAEVDTYTSDEFTMNNIRSGNYSAVFMCGFYSDSRAENFGEMVDACKQSSTKLAIFPAHNETRSVIEYISSKYPQIVVLDWKAEIDNHIANGVDYDLFCIDDAHRHSTSLAGYVGAHMIYRAVFNKIPKAKSFEFVSKEEISLLGDYAQTGTIDFADKNSMYSLE